MNPVRRLLLVRFARLNLPRKAAWLYLLIMLSFYRICSGQIVPSWFPKPPPLPPPRGEVIRVHTAHELLAAVDRLSTGGTILLADGVAFGNPGKSTANLEGERLVYVSEGIIRNNFIAGGPDCGIELGYADGIKVLNNSIWRPEQNWNRGIRIGTGTSNTEVANNLVHGGL